MTHDKFIELLNLYLDGDLSPNEAAGLEREIHGNVERRRIYRQYCQMQRACADLSERFREEASPAAQFRSGAVVELPRRASGDWFRSIALVASGAAAACGVFMVLQLSVPEAAESTVAQSGAPVPITATTVAAGAQVVPATMNVAANNPALFNNPWAASQPSTQRALRFSTLSPDSTALMLSVPEFKLQNGSENLQIDLQPYGTPPGELLRMEEIETAAFQLSH